VGLLSGTQRALFAMALITFGLASMYTAIALLTRVTPALFPGKNFELPVLTDITGKIGVPLPSDNNIFNKRVNLLIIGVDARPGADESTPLQYRFAGNTDTIMVASVDPLSKSVSFLSFPRDMLIDITVPGRAPYKFKLNASYNEGLQATGTVDGGAAQLEGDIKRNFGIDIDYYVTMDFSGVEKLVNAVGGVDLNVPDDLAFYDWYYSDDDHNARYVTVAAGQQHLDGYTAVALGRNRDPSDFVRVKRQQLVLQGVLGKVISQGLLNPLSWGDLWNAYNNTIHTDMSKVRMGGLVPLLHDAVNNTKMYSVADPVDGKPSVWTDMYGDASVVEWDPENIQYWIAQTFTKAAYSASTVEIQNGYSAGDDGSVRSASLGRYLKYSKGLPTVYYGPDQPAQAETTIILYDNAKKELADDIASWLKIPAQNYTIQQRPEGSTLPDVVVIIGRNYKVPGS
jgi:LCP family protein required for cell wall assembly